MLLSIQFYNFVPVTTTESLAELDDTLENGKRISVGLSKYMRTSFDEGSSTKKGQRKTVKSDKPAVLKVDSHLLSFLRTTLSQDCLKYYIIVGFSEKEGN